ncbi:MAG: tRNA (N(6)-L-threonylcarbamoyladenosine(37)-C(2))-methylthiotransferase MtaB [Bacteroidia bacterium]
MIKTAAYYTLGCKLNFSETSTIGRSLADAGFGKAEFHDGADVYVINTCSVTDNADKKCKRVVKEALRFNPDAFIVVTGCYSQLKPKEVASIPGVDLVLGAAEKFNIAKFLGNQKKKQKAEVVDGKIKDVVEYHSSFSVGERTRSFLKIQDGCDYFCSFCTIPLARGKSRSDSIQNVMKQAREIVDSGVKEIVLTGVNTGDFGNEKGKTFFELLKELETVEGLHRLRISSIEPNLLTDEIIEFVANSVIVVPHFHIPLQSGSGKILKLMRRKYDPEFYASRIQKIRSLMPGCCIGVDVIVGFPGETHEDFIQTYRFLNELEISYLHVFTYSERDNTTAIKLPGRVAMKERNERSKMLHILSDKKRRNFYSENMGKVLPVLWEAENDDDVMYGFTNNYIKVKTAYDPLLVNEIINVELHEIDENMVVHAKRPELVY